jgi:hypothetical protein
MALSTLFSNSLSGHLARATVGGVSGGFYSALTNEGNNPNINEANILSGMAKGALVGGGFMPALNLAARHWRDIGMASVAATENATIFTLNNAGTRGTLGLVGYGTLQVNKTMNNQRSQLDYTSINTAIDQNAALRNESQQLGSGTITAIPNQNRNANNNFQNSAAGLVHGLHRRRHG